jgi:hypothetical protein
MAFLPHQVPETGGGGKTGACNWRENYGNKNGERFFLRGKK